MKLNVVFALVGIGVCSTFGLTSFQSKPQITTYTQKFHQLNSAGSPGYYTGAPGTLTCTSCHSGTVQSGSGMNSVTLLEGGIAVTEYTPGTTYDVLVSLATANGKNGFQVVPLTTTSAQAGTIAISDLTNTKSFVTSGKTTVTHKSNGTALTSWTFKWTAPATNIGTVTFYLATNVTNSNNSETGDVVYVSQHLFGSQAGLTTNGQEISTTASFIPNLNVLKLQLNTAVSGEAAINLVNLEGKSVLFEKLGKVSHGEQELQVRLPHELPAGIYVVHLNVNNNYTAQKIYIAE